jgi:hypothetical protein
MEAETETADRLYKHYFLRCKKKRGIIFSLKVKQCKFYRITCLEKATNNSHDTNFFPMILYRYCMQICLTVYSNIDFVL